MAVTTLFILIPLALIASAIYSYLIFSKIGLYNGIKNKVVRVLLKIITYIVVIVFFTLLLSIIGMLLLLGLIGIPALFVLDIVGIILLIKKIVISIKRKKENNLNNNE